MIKKRDVMLVLTIVCLGVFLYLAGCSQDGVIVGKATTPSMVEKTRTAYNPEFEFEKMEKDVGTRLSKTRLSSSKILSGNKDLLPLITKEQNELVAFQKRFVKAKHIIQKEGLVHEYEHLVSKSTLPYIEKTINLPKTIDDTIILLQKIEKEAKKAPPSDQLKKYQSMLSNTREELLRVKKLHKKSLYKKSNEEIEKIRRQFIRESYALQNYYSTNAKMKSLLSLNKNARLKFRLAFPHYLSDKESGKQNKNIGNLDIFVCQINWGDGSEVVFREEGFSEKIKNKLDKASAYLEEVSYNKYDVHFVLSPVVEWDGPPPNDALEEFAIALEVCDPLVDFRLIDGIIISPSHLGMGQTYYNTETQDGEIDIPAAHVDLSNREVSIITHELGHAVFNFFHATFLDCGSSSFEANEGVCSSIEYGNPYDNMGVIRHSGHYNAWYKVKAGFAKEREVVEDGTYTLDAIEIFSGGPKLLRIPYTDYPLCIEYRKAIGFDNFLGRQEEFLPSYVGVLSSLTPPSDGCLLITHCFGWHYPAGNYYRPKTALIDTKPELPVLDGYYSDSDLRFIDTLDPCLPKNTIFSNDDIGLSVSFRNPGPIEGPRGTPIIQNRVSVTIDIDETREMEDDS